MILRIIIEDPEVTQTQPINLTTKTLLILTKKEEKYIFISTQVQFQIYRKLTKNSPIVNII